MTRQPPARDDAWLRRLVAKAKDLPIDKVTDHVLREFLEQCACKATRSLPKWIRKQICDEAMSIIGDALFSPDRAGYDPQRNTPFRAWCEAVLRNAAVDLTRRASRFLPTGHGGESGGTGSEDEGDWGSLEPVSREADPSEEAQRREEFAQDGEQLRAWRDGLRELLDQIAWPAASGGKVDYFAVLLLELRLRVAGAVFHADADAKEGPGGAAAQLVRWHEDEWSRWLHLHWPSIGELWAELAPRLEKPPYVELLCTTIERLGAARGVEAKLTPFCWRQWCHRAAGQAKNEAPGQWEEWLARWFPSRETKTRTKP